MTMAASLVVVSPTLKDEPPRRLTAQTVVRVAADRKAFSVNSILNNRMGLSEVRLIL